MNDFDQFLELKLRHMLDPVVATPAPPRGRIKRTKRPILAVEAPLGLAVEAIPVVDPVTIPVLHASQL